MIKQLILPLTLTLRPARFPKFPMNLLVECSSFADAQDNKSAGVHHAMP